ncbi:MAG: alpha/beta hydrolase [Caulobacteraceae bacterium]
MTDLTIDNNGVKLAASVYGLVDGPPILLLHGISLSRDTWDEIGERLSSRFRVWTIDLRGHGHSDHVPHYDLAGYVSDAVAALDTIGQPTVVVGHSLSGVVAGVLAQQSHPNLLGAMLVDPPWYIGEPEVRAKSVMASVVFRRLSTMQAALQAEDAPLSAFADALGRGNSPLGGKARDHYTARQMLCWGSAMQRQDNRCWEGAISGALLDTLDTERPFACPVKVIQADPRLGAGLLAGHELRLAETHPEAEIVRYDNAVHAIHMLPAFEERFAEDIAAFSSKLTG